MSSTATEKMAASTSPRWPARAEHIGSLLRPPHLKALVEQTYEPGHSALLAAERAKDLRPLHEAEDAAIREAVRRQLDIGLDVVSDGEFRRYMFTGSFYDAVSGLAAGTGQVPFTNEDGEVEFYTGLPVVDGPLEKIDSPGAHEAEFMRGLTDHPVKVTFPAASIFWLLYLPEVNCAISASTCFASSIFSSRLSRGTPWSRKASSVAGGTVLTVLGPISSST